MMSQTHRSVRTTWSRLWLAAIVALVVGLALFAAACGDDGGDDQAKAEVEAVVRATFDAWNAKDVAALRALFTDEVFVELLSFEEGQTADEAAAGLAEIIGVEQITNPTFSQTTVEGTTATTEVQYAFGKGVTKYRFSFIRENGAWKIDGQEELLNDVPAGVTLVHVGAREYAFDVDTSTIADGNVAFELENIGGEDHQLLVVRFVDRDITLDELLASESESIYYEGVEDTGGKDAAPGETVNLVFSEPLAPGHYAMLCFVEAADGEPHALKGMTKEFTIE